MVKKVMVRSVGPAGLERIELKRLTERVEWLSSLLQEAVAAQTPAIAGTWAPSVDVCETTKAINVRIELPGGEELLGTAVDLDTDGRLILADRDGVARSVAAGDVTHVR